MSKPNPDIFARLVLTDLASVYAELARTQAILLKIAEHLNIPDRAVWWDNLRKDSEREARSLSSEALKFAGVDDPEPPAQ
jgi:hypothetical protein